MKRIALAVGIFCVMAICVLMSYQENKSVIMFNEGYADGCADVKRKTYKKTFYIKQESPYVIGYDAGYKDCLSFGRP